MLNRLILLVFIAFLVCGTVISKNHKEKIQSSDDYVRDRVVLLKSTAGSCSGAEVIAPSGKIYTLTAGHCRPLLSAKNTVVAQLEDGREYTLKFVALDKKSDLMLLEGIDTKGLVVRGKSLEKHEHVYTMTHGLGFPSYRTDGEVLVARLTQTINFKWLEMYISAPVLPGSSGGPVLDSKNELIGIVSVSVGDTFIGGMVLLSDIHNFLKNR